MTTPTAEEEPSNATSNGYMNGHDNSPGQSPSEEGFGVQDDLAKPLPQMKRQPSVPNRRSSSVRTASSSRRPSASSTNNLGASTDSLLLPRPTDHDREHDDPTLWHSAPLLFAIVPAIGGVVFKSGSIILTDLALLILAALYLNWCLVTPWIWYRSAQSVKVIEPRNTSSVQESEDFEGSEDVVENAMDTLSPAAPQEKNAATATAPPDRQDAPAAYDAFNELRMHEVTALALCFLGPLLGSYILHIIRSQLSTMGDQLISNLNLTLFVLGSEIRPLRHGMKMAQARTLYLQRIVKEDPYISTKDKDQDAILGEVRDRLDELETSCAEKFSEESFGNTSKQPDNSEAVKRLQSSTQSQIDALNRAVRRYEKRETTHTMQTESRLQELELRLKETISLAAAAANMSQKPGLMMVALDWTTSLIAIPLKVAYTTCVLPFEVINGFLVTVALRLGVVQARPRKAVSVQPVRTKSQQSARLKSGKSVA